jgi:hypothetical protein
MEYEREIETLKGRVPQIADLQGLIETSQSEKELGMALKGKGISTQEQGRIIQARRLMVGARAGADEGQMLQAMEGAAPGFAATMKMKGIQPLQQFGDNIGEQIRNAMEQGQGAVVRMVLEEQLGMTKEQIIMMEKVANNGSDTLGAIQKSGITNTKQLHAQFEEAKKLGLFFKEGKLMKGLIDAEGKISEENAIAIRDADADGVEDLLRGIAESDAMSKAAVESDRDISNKIKENTISIADTLDQVIVGILNDTYGELRFIGTMLKDTLGKLSSAERSTRENAQKATRRIKGVEKAEKALEKAKESKDPAKIKKAQEDLAAAQQKLMEDVKDTTLTGRQGALGGEIAGQLGKTRGKKEQKAIGAEIGKGTTSVESLYGETIGKEGFWGGAGEFLMESTMAAGRGVYAGGAALANWRDPQAQYFIEGIDDMDPEFIKRVGGRLALEQIADEAAAKVKEETGDFASKNPERFNELLNILIGQRIEAFGGGAGEVGRGGGVVNSMGNFVDQIEQKMGENAIQVDDALIRPNARPILLNDKDDLLAMKPGGAVAQALEGLYATGASGKSGNVSVNVFGGNQSDVYATVMKALKAAGLA